MVADDQVYVGRDAYVTLEEFRKEFGVTWPFELHFTDELNSVVPREVVDASGFPVTDLPAPRPHGGGHSYRLRVARGGLRARRGREAVQRDRRRDRRLAAAAQVALSGSSQDSPTPWNAS
jgi:hypothetical protein